MYFTEIETAFNDIEEAIKTLESHVEGLIPDYYLESLRWHLAKTKEAYEYEEDRHLQEIEEAGITDGEEETFTD